MNHETKPEKDDSISADKSVLRRYVFAPVRSFDYKRTTETKLYKRSICMYCLPFLRHSRKSIRDSVREKDRSGTADSNCAHDRNLQYTSSLHNVRRGIPKSIHTCRNRMRNIPGNGKPKEGSAVPIPINL